MILVDTSVLIDYFRGSDNKYVKALDAIIDNKIPFGINDFIFQELLQGSKTEKEFKIQKEYLETIPFYYLQNGNDSYADAAYLNFLCRKSGVTIRSTIDLLIVQTAIENNLFLMHNDKDFDSIKTVTDKLKIYEC